jgi:hypothetical protein
LIEVVRQELMALGVKIESVGHAPH